MSNQNQKNNDKVFDLVERTEQFGEKAIEFAKVIPKNVITLPIISQFIRSATSVGANYMEADCAESKKDFFHKIAIAKKEAKETTHWLRMIAKATPELSEDCRGLWKESHELTLILSSIHAKK